MSFLQPVFVLFSINDVCKNKLAFMFVFPFDPSVGSSPPGAGAAHWEGVGHFAGTHQDCVLVPVQPGQPNTDHLL